FTIAGILVALLSQLFFQREPARNCVMLVLNAGFSGMMMETVFLLNYQTKTAMLYQELGLLLTIFMLGLALGALGTEKFFQQRESKFPDSIQKQLTTVRRSGWVLLTIFGLTCVAFAFGVRVQAVSALAETSVLLFWTGAVVSAIFVVALHRDSGDPLNSLSSLYAADVIGGCLGVFLGSMVTIPLTGMTATSLCCSILSWTNLLLL
ncbi:MAG: hypothetical protein L7F78_19985, partial [Syntrophales bacterium LBB04]|nr:hypothetical protein [Syntrophales bacterium LBB04]